VQSNNVKSVGVHSQLSHNQLLIDGVLVTAFVHSGQYPKPLATLEKVSRTIFFFFFNDHHHHLHHQHQSLILLIAAATNIIIFNTTTTSIIMEDIKSAMGPYWR
jgi:hypothetical protein